ncbi:unnamed protein product, partial [marine sediment metagenome]
DRKKRAMHPKCEAHNSLQKGGVLSAIFLWAAIL